MFDGQKKLVVVFKKKFSFLECVFQQRYDVLFTDRQQKYFTSVVLVIVFGQRNTL